MAAPSLVRPAAAPLTIGIALTSLASWVITVVWARSGDMGAMPGTMGMSLASFVAMWAVMMAAMMLPSVGPFAGLYEQTITEHRGLRLTGLAAGYLAVWSAAGFVAYVVADVFGDLARERPNAARAVAVVTFAAVGIYQLTPLKYRCLSHCRTPIGHLVHYLGFTGKARDFRAGVSHGWFCLGCCWALMVLMVAFGVMNIVAMVGLAIVITVEKVWRHGEMFAKAVGVACLGYAVALVFFPELAPGLDPGAVMQMRMM